jgi:hypothetical protein
MVGTMGDVGSGDRLALGAEAEIARLAEAVGRS